MKTTNLKHLCSIFQSGNHYVKRKYFLIMKDFKSTKYCPANVANPLCSGSFLTYSDLSASVT